MSEWLKSDSKARQIWISNIWNAVRIHITTYSAIAISSF